MSPWYWIAFTLLAVSSQAIRSAGQKVLSHETDAVTATMVRFVFGLPFAALYLVSLVFWSDISFPSLHATFLLHACIASLFQILATILLVSLFSVRNFAVSTTFARSEAILTAIVGVTLFGEHLSNLGWLAIAISTVGILALSVSYHAENFKMTNFTEASTLKSAVIGVGSGLCFAFTSLHLRTASLSLSTTDSVEGSLLSAAITLVAMLVLQSVLCLGYLYYRSPARVWALKKWLRTSWLVGFTSALGSVGWFTAMTLERAAYVKTLGQIEFLLALAISYKFFKEKSHTIEIFSMVLVAIGILVLLYDTTIHQ